MKRFLITALIILLVTVVLILFCFGFLNISNFLKENIITDYRVFFIIIAYGLVVYLIILKEDYKYETRKAKRYLQETSQYLTSYIEKYNKLVDVNYSVDMDKNQSMFYEENEIRKLNPSCIIFATEINHAEKRLRNALIKLYLSVNFKYRKNLKKIISRFINYSISNSNILNTYKISYNGSILFEADNHDLLVDILNEERKILHEYIKEVKKIK